MKTYSKYEQENPKLGTKVVVAYGGRKFLVDPVRNQWLWGQNLS